MSNRYRRSTRSSAPAEEIPLLNIHLHIKHNAKKTVLPSTSIPIHNLPLLHPLLSNIRLDIDYEELKSIVQGSMFLNSEKIRRKYGDMVLFDERVGLIGWKGSRKEDEDAKTKLRGKAAVEIGDDNAWKAHVSDYAGVNSNGVRCIDIGISLFGEERITIKKKRKSSSSSSCSDDSQLIRKRSKSPKKPIYGFRAPKTLLLHMLSPVEYYEKDGLSKVRNTIPLGEVEVDFDQYILNAYDSEDGCSDEEITDMSSVSFESSIMVDNGKKKKTDDDDLVLHIYESIRHIIAHTVLENKNGAFSIYADRIGKKSCIYATTKKSLNPKRINNTKELVSFIKDAAKKDTNWKEKGVMEFRVALGARREDDPVCTAKDFDAMGMLLEAEELFSQEVLDIPFDNYNGKVASSVAKRRPMEIERFLDGLYNDEKSQLYHGYTNEMKVVLRNAFMVDKEFYNTLVLGNKGSFPVEHIAYERLVSYLTTTKAFVHLHPEKNKFPPHDPRKPPSFNQWKRTETGRNFAKSTQSLGRNETVLSEMLMSRFGGGIGRQTQLSTMATKEKNSDENLRLGMVEIESGIEVIKIPYSSNTNQNDDDCVNLNVTLRDLVVKSKRWPRYNSLEKERIYEVVRANGLVYTTFKKADLHKFTLGKLLDMMNFPVRGEVLKIRGGFTDLVRVEDDEYDTLSL
jgi:hypothetical protein